MRPQDHSGSGRFLTFHVGSELYALPSEDVLEVIRMPALARVPQGPPALLGIANLRGAVLPIAGLRQLLGQPAAADDSGARAIVLDIGAPIAVQVDSVAALESAVCPPTDGRPTESGAQGAQRLPGAISLTRDAQVAKLLDIKSMLEAAFANRARVSPGRSRPQASAPAAARTHAADASEMLVTFDVASQEFALPLTDVQEIIPAPADVTAVAHSDAVVVGLTTVRDTLLPVLSLRALLGFPAARAAPEREKVLVVKVSGMRIGLLADGARAVLAAQPERLDPVPPALAARTGGESRIRSVYRGESGRRLISVLSPQQLFRDDVMQKLDVARSSDTPDAPAQPVDRQELLCLVFRLGGDEFGLPVEAVVEVARVPDQITRLPKTPKFLEGVVNLRGEVLPVIDQRRRFEMPPVQELASRRLIVVETERHRAAVIVDGVTEVLRASVSAIEAAPDLTDEISRLVRGVINLPASSRMVLLLDPMELLTRAERGLLDRFEAQRRRADV